MFANPAHVTITNVDAWRFGLPASGKIVPGTYGYNIVDGFCTSGEDDFYKYINIIERVFLRGLDIDSIVNLLILIHSDGTADIYIDKFVIFIEILAKKAIKKGDIVGSDHIADIRALKFPNIEIKPDDGIVFCFRKRFKTGLYLNFRSADKEGNIIADLDLGELWLNIGRHYKFLAFNELYNVMAYREAFELLINDGWFPFIEILGAEFNLLSDYYTDIELYKKHKDIIQDTITNIICRFDKERIINFSSKWWNKEIFRERKTLIQAGIDAYLRDDNSGYINCINTLFPQIEGVLRICCFKDTGKNNITMKDLQEYAKSKAEKRFDTRDSLGFPNYFYEYLNKYYFNHFDLSTGSIELSRHSCCHGVADEDQYTKVKALQSILILDQINFFI